MSDPNKPKSSSKDAFTRGVDIFSVVLSIVLTALFAGQFYHLTERGFVGFAGDQYGDGWQPFFRFLWMLCSGAGTFSLCLALIAMTLRMGAAKLAGWLFRD
jgi:hypothetical protein